MPGGLFYQPRDLSSLSTTELEGYAVHCRSMIDRTDREVAGLQGELGALSEGWTEDRVINYGGFALAVVGIGTTAILSPLGFLALAGGVMSLIGVSNTMSRGARRSQVIDTLANKRASIDFCSAEQRRIGTELDRRQGQSAG